MVEVEVSLTVGGKKLKGSGWIGYACFCFCWKPVFPALLPLLFLYLQQRSKRDVRLGRRAKKGDKRFEKKQPLGGVEECSK